MILESTKGMSQEKRERKPFKYNKSNITQKEKREITKNDEFYLKN